MCELYKLYELYETLSVALFISKKEISYDFLFIFELMLGTKVCIYIRIRIRHLMDFSSFFYMDVCCILIGI
jgi:hypothetical protein